MSDEREFIVGGDAPSAIEEAAAQWAVRHQGRLSASESRAFRRWLAEDPRHAAVYSEMTETSDLLDLLRDPALAGDAPSGATSIRPSVWRTWGPRTALAAAALVVAGVLWLNRSERRADFAESVVTEVGGRRELRLPDGSSVLLNTDSALAVDYDARGRRVRLSRGEAFFSVAKDAERPFRVEVGSVSVRAVGTAFNVRYRPNAVEVVVKEGRVSVNPFIAPSDQGGAAAEAERARGEQADPHLLEAGQFAKIALGTAVAGAGAQSSVEVDAMETLRLESLLAWQSGRLEFSETPLAEVVAEFNRYNRHKLVIDDPTLAAQTFGGSFAPSGYDSLVDVLKSFGVVAVRGGDRTILRRAN